MALKLRTLASTTVSGAFGSEDYVDVDDSAKFPNLGGGNTRVTDIVDARKNGRDWFHAIVSYAQEPGFTGTRAPLPASTDGPDENTREIVRVYAVAGARLSLVRGNEMGITTFEDQYTTPRIWGNPEGWKVILTHVVVAEDMAALENKLIGKFTSDEAELGTDEAKIEKIFVNSLDASSADVDTNLRVEGKIHLGGEMDDDRTSLSGQDGAGNTDIIVPPATDLTGQDADQRTIALRSDIIAHTVPRSFAVVPNKDDPSDTSYSLYGGALGNLVHLVGTDDDGNPNRLYAPNAAHLESLSTDIEQPDSEPDPPIEYQIAPEPGQRVSLLNARLTKLVDGSAILDFDGTYPARTFKAFITDLENHTGVVTYPPDNNLQVANAALVAPKLYDPNAVYRDNMNATSDPDPLNPTLDDDGNPMGDDYINGYRAGSLWINRMTGTEWRFDGTIWKPRGLGITLIYDTPVAINNTYNLAFINGVDGDRWEFSQFSAITFVSQDHNHRRASTVPIEIFRDIPEVNTRTIRFSDDGDGGGVAVGWVSETSFRIETGRFFQLRQIYGVR